MIPFTSVDIAPAVLWLAAIPFEDWPQQHRLADQRLRPAMVTDLDWHGFGATVAPIVDRIIERFPGGAAFQLMLSAVMPGHSIPPHRDGQAPYWVCRVHVPLTSNDKAWFVTGGHAHRLRPGFAYKIDTQAEHAVANDGDTPRVHFMFDVRGQ